MNTEHKNGEVAVVAGVGPGLGTALCDSLLAAGFEVAGLSRSSPTQTTHSKQTLTGDKFLPIACDLTNQSAVDSAITQVEQTFGTVSVYIHNAAVLLHRDFLQTPAKDFADLWNITCLGAVHGIQRVLPNMVAAKKGTVLVTGATASVKAGAHFAAFSSAKFALRGLAQSLAREFGPKGIHVAHIIIDGVIWGQQAKNFGLSEHQCLQAQAIANTYLHLIQQQRSAWTQELDLRPDIETF